MSFIKPKRNKHLRPRPTSLTDGDDADSTKGSSVVRAVKVPRPNPMVHATDRRDGDAAPVLGAELAYASDRRISNYDTKATAANEQDVARDRDAQALYEQAQAQWDDGGDTAADGTKIYRGAKAYRQYTSKAENFDGAVMQGAGPARAPVHYRATSRFDYQPDVCKDYKDTGYCGYGDACKFLHDRSDYKSGWQLEKQWEEEQKAKRHEEALVALGEAPVAAAAAATDELPFACLACREPWHARSQPVSTKCQHYFCEACALRHFQRSRRCFVCGEQTGGIFNRAKLLQEKIDARIAAEEAEAAPEIDSADLQKVFDEETAKEHQRSTGWATLT